MHSSPAPSQTDRTVPLHVPKIAFFGLFLAAGFIGFVGLGHECGEGYYTDEGHYLHHARRLLSGDYFVRTFIYPHLMYHFDAAALWLAGLWPAGTAALAKLWGVDDPMAIDWLVLRWVQATIGVLTVVPVVFLGRRIGGAFAGWLGGALIVLATPYHLGFQVNISDVPSAFFATLCLFFVGRLIDRDRPLDWALAGMASGLAAGSKYPAGVVATAIIAMWIFHAVRRRREGRLPGWGLVIGGASSLAAFLACIPSIFVHPDAALTGPRGFLFGVRQYAGGGWAGVQPPNIPLYYWENIVESFRWPAILLAVVGVVSLAVRERQTGRRLAMILPFPLAYLFLICSMSMVVLRNLFPVLPALAVVLGVAIAAATRMFVARFAIPPAVLQCLVAVAVLAWPAWEMAVQTAGLTQPSTRDLMSEWVEEQLPPGAGILKESYTPNFSREERPSFERRFIFRIPDEKWDDPRFDFMLVASSAYGRFYQEKNGRLETGKWYDEQFERHTLVHEVKGSRLRRGPDLQLYLLNRPQRAVERRVFQRDDAFISHPSMHREESMLSFTHYGRKAVFREMLAAGEYRVRIATVDPLSEKLGSLHIVDVRGTVFQTWDQIDFKGEVISPRLSLKLDEDRLCFFVLELPKGTKVKKMMVRPLMNDPESPDDAEPPDDDESSSDVDQ